MFGIASLGNMVALGDETSLGFSDNFLGEPCDDIDSLAWAISWDPADETEEGTDELMGDSIDDKMGAICDVIG